MKVQHCISVCLSPYLWNEEKQQQWEREWRQEAQGRDKAPKIKDGKGNKFMCTQQYWCKRQDEIKRMGRYTVGRKKGFILWLILLSHTHEQSDAQRFAKLHKLHYVPHEVQAVDVITENILTSVNHLSFQEVIKYTLLKHFEFIFQKLK